MSIMVRLSALLTEPECKMLYTLHMEWSPSGLHNEAERLLLSNVIQFLAQMVGYLLLMYCPHALYKDVQCKCAIHNSGNLSDTR